jgi:hypothetical protein
MKVSQLIEELKKYPADANAYAYEGEVCGVVIVDRHKRFKELGVIEANESDEYSKMLHEELNRADCA